MRPAIRSRPHRSRDRRRAIIFLAISTLMSLVAACSQLDRRGLLQPLADEDLSAKDVIAWQPLRRDHFRAATPPPFLVDDTSSLAAHAAIVLRLRPTATYVEIGAAGGPDQRHCVEARRLFFEAVLLPHRSWWNPSLPAARSESTLQHEFIHFALMEAAARRLNCRLAAAGHDLRACAKDVASAQAIFAATVETWLHEEHRRVMKQHGDFDHATSRLHDPLIQQWWYDRVMAELSQPQPGVP